MIALAEALKLPFETKHLHYNALRLLGPQLLGSSLASLTSSSRDLILSEAPPDLTLSAGHRSVAAVQALRHRSRGRVRSIHVGFPRVSPGQFDLVIATPQYPVPEHRNLLRVPFALTRAATAAADPADAAILAALAEPRRLLIIGGPTPFWTIDEGRLLENLRVMLAEAASDGGSVLVTSSPRTPLSVTDAIERELAASPAPTLLARPGQSPRYSSLLEAADTIRVTADSVAMISDAIWTAKPVALVPIRKSMLGRTIIGAMERIRPGQRLYPQDLRFFWRALADIGITERPAVPRTSTEDQMHRILARVQPILDALRPNG